MMRRSFLTAALLLLIISTIILATGGFTASIAGVRVSARSPATSAALAGLTGILWLVTAARARRAMEDLESIGSWIERRAAWLMATAAGLSAAVSIRFHSFSANGADPSGYLSEAALIASLRMFFTEPLAAFATWPAAARTLAPLGWSAVDSGLQVPTYAAGLPLLMAWPHAAAGALGASLVVCAAAACATWFAGRTAETLAGRSAGVPAAAAVATLPVLLFESFQVMSDVPVTAAWLACWYGVCSIVKDAGRGARTQVDRGRGGEERASDEEGRSGRAGWGSSLPTAARGREEGIRREQGMGTAPSSKSEMGTVPFFESDHREQNVITETSPFAAGAGEDAESATVSQSVPEREMGTVPFFKSDMGTVPIFSSCTNDAETTAGASRRDGRTGGSVPHVSLVRALFAGVAAALAVLIRPNLAPLTALPALCLWASLPRRARACVVWFSAPVAAAGAVVAVLHWIWFGSPLRSGYGTAAELYSLANVGPNVALYSQWLRQAGMVWLLAAPAALATRERALPGWLLAFTTATCFAYFIYATFETWTYLRFLLPGLSLAAVLAVVAAVRAVGRLPAWTRGGLIVLLSLTIAAFQIGRARELDVFSVPAHQARAALAGHYLAAAVPPNAVLITGEQSGAMRYYTGRPIVRWDLLDAEGLSAVLRMCEEHGFEPWFVLDDWEAPRVREKFRALDVAALDWPPILDAGSLVRTQAWRPRDRERFLSEGRVISDRLRDDRWR